MGQILSLLWGNYGFWIPFRKDLLLIYSKSQESSASLIVNIYIGLFKQEIPVCIPNFLNLVSLP